MAMATTLPRNLSKNLLSANNAHFISDHCVSPAHSSKVALGPGGIADMSFISNTNRAAFS
jgi:hypothetical protein